ncbi:MAG: isochorismatase family protein [Oscillospiraceae bacterium]|nr:isochorismatase family protein [Oscillospiraceae bacterium]
MKLIVIDMQKGILEDEGLFRRESVLENAVRILRAARENGVEALFVQHDDGPDSGFTAGDEAFEIADELAPLKGEKRFVKTEGSCFTNPDFAAYLEASGDDTLMITGLVLNYCVDKTVKSADERGYFIVIPRETTSTFDNPYMNAETTCEYYFNCAWEGVADCVSTDEAIALIRQSHS